MKLEIKANQNSLKENDLLVERSIVPQFKKNGFSIFMLNIASVKNKGFDLKNDIFAQASDHICVVDTCLKPHNDNNFDIPGWTFDHVSVGKGKGAGIFSLTSRYIPMRNQKVAKDKYQILSIVDETNPRLPYQMVLVYASSGCPLQKLAEDLKIEFIADLTLFHMTMGQYDPDCPNLSTIASISAIGFPKFMTLFLLKFCKSQ